MAASDARPVPRKNTAFRVTFGIFDADGDLVTGASGLDSEVSKDGGTFADCTNEATEIATSSGMYYLDLTADEMNADTVAIIVKTSTSGAKTTPIVMYPEEAGDFRLSATPPTAAEIADAVWDEATTSHTTSGTFGEQVKTDIDAILTDTGTDGVVVASHTTAAKAEINAEADTAISDAALATAANLATVAGYLDTEIAAILADTNELQTDWANGGRLDLILDARASQTSVDDVPTNSELSNALAAADDAVLAAIAALNDISVADVLAGVVEGSETLAQTLRLLRAALVGKSAGGGSTSITFRDAADSKNRIAATVTSDGNRTAVTTDAT